MSRFKEFIEGVVQRGDVEGSRKAWRKEYAVERYGVFGWTALHWACEYADGDREGLVRLLLSLGCDLEAEDIWKRRPIHFCASNGRIGPMRILLEAGCSLTCLDREGETPLMEAEMRKEEEAAVLLRSAMQADIALQRLNSIMLSEEDKDLVSRLLTDKGKRVLKVVNEREIDDWQSRDMTGVDPQTRQLIHECLMMRCIVQKYDHGVDHLFTTDIINGDLLIIGPTTLETSVTFGTFLLVNYVLRKLVKVDESWKRAEDIAKKNKRTSVRKLISNRRSYLESQKRKGISRLHIAVIENDPDMVDHLLKNDLIDADECNKNLGPAISLAYTIGHTDCAQRLQAHNVNVNIVNRWRQTPLHVAISNGIDLHCGYLVDNTVDMEAQDLMDKTVLTRSVMNDCRDICERLVMKGAICNEYIEISPQALQDDPDFRKSRPKMPIMNIKSRETIYSLCLKVNDTIYPCLLGKINLHAVNMVDGLSNSILHLSAACLMSEMCSQLISKSANINATNDYERTPLMEMLEQNSNGNMEEIGPDMIKTVNVLMEGGASLDVEDEAGCSLLDKATSYNNESLISALIHDYDQPECVRQSQWLAWIDRGYFKVVRQTMPVITPSLLTEWITVDIITGMLQTGDTPLAKLMYDRGSSAVRKVAVETILYHAAQVGDADTFRSIINDDISPDSSLDGGQSLMHLLVRDKKADFIQYVLRSRNCLPYLEKKDAGNKLPLHVCIECDYWDVLDQLIVNTSSVDVEDNSDNTPLSLLLTKISVIDDERIITRLLTSIKLLINNSANINFVNRLNRKVITYCTKENLRSEIESFFQRNQPRQEVADPPLEEPPAALVCQICEDEPKNCVLNCGHIFCMTCAERTIDCYVCRNRITHRIRFYL